MGLMGGRVGWGWRVWSEEKLEGIGPTRLQEKATEQTSHVTVNPCHCLFDTFTLDSEPDNDGSMGNVGSREEKRDSLPTSPGGLRGRRQPDGLLRKGTSQRGVLGYFHWGKRDTRAEKKHQSSGGGLKRDYECDQENQSPERYFRDHQQAADFSKSSLPEHGCFNRCRIRPSAFKVVSWKSLFCMPRRSSAKGQKLPKSNRSLTQNSTSSSSQCSPLRSHLLHTISLDESTKAIQSFPTNTPPFKPAPTQLSASVGHKNQTGHSLDRASRGPHDALAVDKTPPSCKSLSPLPSSGEPHPPNEPTNSSEDVVKELEDRQTEKGMESNLSENDDPFTQIFEDKWRLWMDELDELKQEIQLQLCKAEQEEKRLQEELDLQQRVQHQQAQLGDSSPTLPERGSPVHS
ncbi:NEDD4-binding protein 3 homolog [Podarcis raffonei]|uniref:NEDD4-binding protein 3 homolog n=1 Tax=Podarcis raffonei TaxID=65483 RepID=UPI00232980E1|nr:NEDD4-binding protein 3 homolog [Podarcis raffonei]